jgi:hypothetical protein
LIFSAKQQNKKRTKKGVALAGACGKMALSANNTTHTAMMTAFKEFKIAALPETTADAIGFFEAVALAGLEKKYTRISADTQRRHFGCVPFGKLAVRVENGVCRTIKSQAFGHDYDTSEAYWSMSDNAWRSTLDGGLLRSFPKA